MWLHLSAGAAPVSRFGNVRRYTSRQQWTVKHQSRAKSSIRGSGWAAVCLDHHHAWTQCGSRNGPCYCTEKCITVCVLSLCFIYVCITTKWPFPIALEVIMSTQKSNEWGLICQVFTFIQWIPGVSAQLWAQPPPNKPSLHFQPPNQKDCVQQAADFLDSGDSLLASLPLDSISATASLPTDYKGFPPSGDSHSIITSP